MNINPHKIVLNDIKTLLQKIDADAFVKKNEILSGASIGEHLRHIIEFYLCCLQQHKNTTINYDLRERNKELETNKTKGIEAVDFVFDFLNKLENKDDKNLIMRSVHENEEEDENAIKTTFFRELNYCMDHGIHHQSLIKIALIDHGIAHLIHDNLGVAFSTQNYRNQCVS